MNKNFNIDISKMKRIHCIGIGGIGLSAVAEILNNQGYEVSGSDLKSSIITDHLESKGIKIFKEHLAENVRDVDIVIFSNAVSFSNPEMVEAKRLGIPRITRAEMLGIIMKNYEHSIAICGTHGKTTTTSMISLIIRGAKLNPTILIGAEFADIHGNVEIGGNEYFVTEACEYMDSFLSLYPNIGVILNIDSDHLDYFKDVEHIVKSFKKFASQIPDDGVIIAFSENPFMEDVIKEAKNVITYGFNDDNDYSAKNVNFTDKGFAKFDVYYKGKKECHIDLSVPGEHNVLNSLAAFATCRYIGIESCVISKILSDFKGADRRFDYVGKTKCGAYIIDDYAHHPTEIKATISATANVKHNNSLCVFQPHTYTRTKALFNEFIDAFNGLDTLIITDIYAAREKDIYGISSEQLVSKIKEKYPEFNILYIKQFEEIRDYILDNISEGDIVITMGAGDVYKIGEILIDK